jgi:hypothetical protein
MALSRLFPEILKLPWIAVAVISGLPPGTVKRTDFDVVLAPYRPDCIPSGVPQKFVSYFGNLKF